MNTIPLDGLNVLFLNVFTVKPENQDALIACMREGVLPGDVPGLISANLLKSRDGTRVINQMVWESQEAFAQAAATNQSIKATRQRVQGLIESAAPDAFDVIAMK
jgi:heme-degrading monooxygenase HmoA